MADNGTVTGRYAHHEQLSGEVSATWRQPLLNDCQNIPKAVDLDYAAVELKILAFFSN